MISRLPCVLITSVYCGFYTKPEILLLFHGHKELAPTEISHFNNQYRSFISLGLNLCPVRKGRKHTACVQTDRKCNNWWFRATGSKNYFRNDLDICVDRYIHLTSHTTENRETVRSSRIAFQRNYRWFRPENILKLSAGSTWSREWRVTTGNCCLMALSLILRRMDHCQHEQHRADKMLPDSVKILISVNPQVHSLI